MSNPQIKDQELLIKEIIKVFNENKAENHISEDALYKKIATLFANDVNEKLQSEDREVTILLSDIRGFTALSEQYQAIEIVNMLNHYFTRMNEIIIRYGGMIDKYMGDAIMVLFGAQHPKDDDSLRAVACAVEMQIAMDEVNNDNDKLNLPNLFMGIGINTGKVSAGDMGSKLHHEYTVIGDGVNLTSRIESHSLRGQILISEYTYKEVSEHVTIGNINQVRVKGKSNLVKLYEINACQWPTLLEVPRREIRTSPRIEIDTTFPFQVIEGKKVSENIHEGKMKDLSYHGFYAIMDTEFDVFTDIKLSLSISLLGGENKDVYAKIMSIRELSVGNYGCGLEFTSLDQDSQDTIKNFIDRIISG